MIPGVQFCCVSINSHFLVTEKSPFLKKKLKAVDEDDDEEDEDDEDEEDDEEDYSLVR